MGWNDHVDWGLLDDIENMVEEGLLDEEEDKELITAMQAVAHYVDGKLADPTPEQRALFDKHIGHLSEDLEKIQRHDDLMRKMDKDD